MIQILPEVNNQLPQTLLNIMVQKEQLAQRAEAQKIAQAEFKMRQEEFQQEQVERQEQRALSAVRVNEIIPAAAKANELQRLSEGCTALFTDSDIRGHDSGGGPIDGRELTFVAEKLHDLARIIDQGDAVGGTVL